MPKARVSLISLFFLYFNIVLHYIYPLPTRKLMCLISEDYQKSCTIHFKLSWQHGLHGIWQVINSFLLLFFILHDFGFLFPWVENSLAINPAIFIILGTSKNSLFGSFSPVFLSITVAFCFVYKLFCLLWFVGWNWDYNGRSKKASNLIFILLKLFAADFMSCITKFCPLQWTAETP